MLIFKLVSILQVQVGKILTFVPARNLSRHAHQEDHAGHAGASQQVIHPYMWLGRLCCRPCADVLSIWSAGRPAVCTLRLLAAVSVSVLEPCHSSYLLLQPFLAGNKPQDKLLARGQGDALVCITLLPCECRMCSLRCTYHCCMGSTSQRSQLIVTTAWIPALTSCSRKDTGLSVSCSRAGQGVCTRTQGHEEDCHRNQCGRILHHHR